MKLAAKKLKLANPVVIMEADLRKGHAKKPGFQSMLEIVRGNPSSDLRYGFASGSGGNRA